MRPRLTKHQHYGWQSNDAALNALNQLVAAITELTQATKDEAVKNVL